MNERTDRISRRSCLKDLFLEKRQSGSCIFLFSSMGAENSFFGEFTSLTPYRRNEKS